MKHLAKAVIHVSVVVSINQPGFPSCNTVVFREKKPSVKSRVKHGDSCISLITRGCVKGGASPSSVDQAAGQVELEAHCRAAIAVDPTRYDAYIELADSLGVYSCTSSCRWLSDCHVVMR